MNIRKAEERGVVTLDWLTSFHSFSFGHYYDPDHMGFHSLRVINEDWVQPKTGFDTHSHDNMEIITYLLAGELEHRDSMGNSSITRPGDIQRMSAGTGVTHSECNPSSTTETHLLQIWFLPDQHNVEPSYQQAHFAPEKKRDTLALLASKTGAHGSVSLHQDVNIYAALLENDASIRHHIKPTRAAWVQVARGSVVINQHTFNAGDGIGVQADTELLFTQGNGAEVVVFDMKSFNKPSH